ncbi:hypothetical protein NDA16_001283 [Ustilago loliicola]|nr:hypothetical protein NDA16_001283 [Ustilago loliicola]
MNRSARAHRSTKIPNVKLRPAQREADILSSASSSKQQQNRIAKRRDQLIDDREDAAHFRQLRDEGHDHGAHLDSDFIGTAARPLKGAIISITGLGDVKAALTQYAREQGARVEGNLTEDVTHLIADRPGSEKYRYALELGMRIVSPDWILDVRDAWLQGEDVDAQELEQKHTLLALSNTTVCFSAVAGAERRKLVALAKQLGATVSDELRFDGSITHLVSATADPNASSSVHHLLHFLDRSRHGRNGTREQAASRILAVRPEWLDDCQKAGGCLSEQVYSIFAKLPDQKERESLIEKARFKLPSPLLREEEQVALPFQGPFIAASSRSKLKFTDLDNSRSAAEQDQDDEDEQPITLGSRQKAAAAGEKSFDNILSQLKSNQPSSSTLAANVTTRPATAEATQPTHNAATLAPASASASTASAPYNPHRNSLLGMSRASSFSPAPPPSTSTATTLNMRKASTTGTAPNKHVAFLHSSPRTNTQSTSSSYPHGVFHDKCFKIALSDSQREQVLEQVLKDNGASLIPLAHKDVPNYVVVEPKIPLASLEALLSDGATPVLHFWIEYCLYHEMFVEPSEYFAGLPAQVPQPLPDGPKLRLLLLGFEPDTPELYHAQKVVAKLGGSIAKQLKGESLTHVLCATQESFNGKRAQKARSCGVPVVALEFLIKARETGRLLPPPQPITMMERSSSNMTTSSSSTSTGLTSHSIPINDQRIEEPTLPLSGCTISRSKVLASQGVMFERKVLQLGACWQAQPNEATTHLLHRGNGAPRESKDLEPGTFLVHPNWLDKCLEQNIRVDESLFPSSMNPARSLLTVLSNSDGSAQGDFLSQASQRVAGSQGSQQQTQTQAELVAAAKPWHRSISVDAARYADNEASKAETERLARGRSEEIEVAPQHGEDGDAADMLLGDVDFDADITLSGDVRQNHIANTEEVAPSSQTLFEGEEDSPLPDIRGIEKGTQPQASPPLKSSKDLTSADEVMQLLRTRTLASSGRKKNRLPPRARKHRSDHLKSTSASSNDMLPPEQVLEAQAALDAQRAAEAAAQGFSLGIDKDTDLMAPQASRRFHEAGVGSRTGLRLSAVARDQDGFEDLEAFYKASEAALDHRQQSAPEDEDQDAAEDDYDSFDETRFSRNSGINGRAAGRQAAAASSSMMDIQNSSAPSPRSLLRSARQSAANNASSGSKGKASASNITLADDDDDDDLDLPNLSTGSRSFDLGAMADSEDDRILADLRQRIDTAYGNDDVMSDYDDIPPPKRKRGRPPKSAATNGTSTQSKSKPKTSTAKSSASSKTKRNPGEVVETVRSQPTVTATVIDENGIRRSTRQRFAPLEYWRGERIRYGRPSLPSGTTIDDLRRRPGEDEFEDDPSMMIPRRRVPALDIKEVIRIPRAPGEGTFSGTMTRPRTITSSRKVDRKSATPRAPSQTPDSDALAFLQLDPTADTMHVEDGWDANTLESGV